MVLERSVTGQNLQEAPKLQLNGIDQALNQGHRLHGFLSGGSLRVISLELEGKETGYGANTLVRMRP